MFNPASLGRSWLLTPDSGLLFSWRFLIEHSFLLQPELLSQAYFVFMGIVDAPVAFVELGKLILHVIAYLIQGREVIDNFA